MVVEWIVQEGVDESFGARELERTMERLISKPLAEAILNGNIRSRPVNAHINKGIVVFQMSGA